MKESSSLNQEQLNLFENLTSTNIAHSSNYTMNMGKQYYEDTSNTTQCHTSVNNIQLDSHRYAAIDEISHIEEDNSILIEDMNSNTIDENKSAISRPSHIAKTKISYRYNKIATQMTQTPNNFSDNEEKPKIALCVEERVYSAKDVLLGISKEDNNILGLKEDGIEQEVSDFADQINFEISKDENSFYRRVLNYILSVLQNIKSMPLSIIKKYGFKMLSSIRDILNYIIQNVKDITHIHAEYLISLRDRINSIISSMKNIPALGIEVVKNIGYKVVNLFAYMKDKSVGGKDYLGNKISGLYKGAKDKTLENMNYIIQKLDLYSSLTMMATFGRERMYNLGTNVKNRSMIIKDFCANKMNAIYTCVKHRVEMSSEQIRYIKTKLKDKFTIESIKVSKNTQRNILLLGCSFITGYIIYQYLNYLKDIDHSFYILYGSMVLGVVIGSLLYQKVKDYYSRNHTLARLCYDDIKKILETRQINGELDPYIIQKEYIILQCQNYNISRYVFTTFIIPRIRELVKLDNCLIEATNKEMRHVWKLNNIIIV
jgi:hypothetical protein